MVGIRIVPVSLQIGQHEGVSADHGRQSFGKFLRGCALNPIHRQLNFVEPAAAVSHHHGSAGICRLFLDSCSATVDRSLPAP